MVYNDNITVIDTAACSSIFYIFYIKNACTQYYFKINVTLFLLLHTHTYFMSKKHDNISTFIDLTDNSLKILSVHFYEIPTLPI